MLNALKKIAHALKVESFDVCSARPVPSNLFTLCLECANSDTNKYIFEIDLECDVDDIKSNFRKSFKPYVSKALKLWDIKVMETNLDEAISEFRQLHIEVSGRETRSENSWRIQQEILEGGNGFLVFVRDKNRELVGAAMFLHTCGLGIYAVAAYRRELFNMPIGHGVQMLAILELKRKGISKYQLGISTPAWKNESISEKEKSIEYFKQGFASYVKVQPILKVNFYE